MMTLPCVSLAWLYWLSWQADRTGQHSIPNPTRQTPHVVCPSFPPLLRVSPSKGFSHFRPCLVYTELRRLQSTDLSFPDHNKSVRCQAGGQDQHSYSYWVLILCIESILSVPWYLNTYHPSLNSYSFPVWLDYRWSEVRLSRPQCPTSLLE